MANEEEPKIISGPADAEITLVGQFISRSKVVLEPIEGDDGKSRIVSREGFQSGKGRAAAVAEGVNQLGTVNIGPISAAAMVSPGIETSPLLVEARFSGTFKVETFQSDFLNESDLSIAGKVLARSSIDQGGAEVGAGPITARIGQAS